MGTGPVSALSLMTGKEQEEPKGASCRGWDLCWDVMVG